ncbi:hypothetical protein, partial [Citrobacter freundii]
EVHQARNSSRRGNKIPFRRRIDSSKPTCRQNRCCKNGSDHRLRFLDTKRENADEKIRIKTLSLGVVIPDVTFRLAKENARMAL